MTRSLVDPIWFGTRQSVEQYDRFEPLRPWEEKVPLTLALSREQRIPPTPTGKLLLGLFLWCVLVFFAGIVPLLINLEHNVIIFQRTAKPKYTIPGWFLIFGWMLIHLLAALAAWFVWMEGGFTNNWKKLWVFFVLISVEVMWCDMAFSGPNLSMGSIWFGAIAGAALLCCIVFWSVFSKVYDLLRPPRDLNTAK